MKTSELQGAALDWAVAKCEGKASRYQSVIDRIFTQSKPDGFGCRLWQGKRNMHDYGLCKVNGKTERAHRALFFALNPTADHALKVLHRCDIPACVNPAHLFSGTQRDNMLDMHNKGRFGGGAKPGNKNAVGNQGWRKGGIVVMKGYVASKLGDEVDVPEELK